MNYYCTLFDSGYLTRGLAMYNSIADTGEDFKLFVFAFDDECYEILSKLNLPGLQPISLKEFENERLLRIKKTRNRGEYCWTCSCFSILHILSNYSVPEVTYLDSDLFFFNKPQILLDEFHDSGKDVLITKHRYTPEYDQSATSGIYCVQFMTFKNNENGLKVLNWWCDRCDEWCYNRMEDGKFGDQKYLDDWMTRFDCCHELQHLGGGVAPWNVQQYTVSEGPFIDNIPIIFYHFHALKWFNENYFDLSEYKLNQNAIYYIYKPYCNSLKKALNYIKYKYDLNFSLGFVFFKKNIINFLRKLKIKIHRSLNNTNNFYTLKD